ncbi:Predicted thiol-disulfide oxidoreductase YuxK, DCC family [Paenimyroides aquimaris]|uniref:Predicted thiol-disulfide oxidoreductase YuxK, DCC family n=1 Tax=Paenimyroides marinum TaxID=1159016 RepID=A0A1H6M5U9_9FLAO|nr:DCC1-like thiol-disulfide oxidoreductase family protein [Paenimyroides aquimaris]SEH93328.1 Predicted thiol-disulfide oxidoreductase YuxK, DCC family [Paenimyroides aquimaris]
MNITDKIPPNKQLILFDGVCNFCDETIQKVIKADKNNVFVFASLQSELGQEILKYIGVDAETDSIILYQPNVAYYTESDAVIEIAKHLSGIYPLLQTGKILPKILRNKMYQYVARNRYKWYGKKEECMIPSPEIRSKFLS